jgi:UDP-N-acetyl-D-glucosamine dehydrogenase
MKIAIIGLGYVGLPLALQFARSDTQVIGVDLDPVKVATLQAGQSYIRHIPAGAVAESIATGRFTPTTDFSSILEVEAVIICVPTPLDHHREPDLSYVLATGRSIATHLRPGTLVALESTSYPGTTDTDLRQVLEAGSGLVAGIDFHLAFSPEREDPGNPLSDVATLPKIIGGLTPACLEKACTVYRRAIANVVPVSDCKTAEAAKLLENIFRSVNIALVNELKVVYAAMGVDIWEVIAAAKTKPFGFMPFYPGPGIGGHCIPVDPFYLTWKAREFGLTTRFIELAGEVNEAMPAQVVRRVGEALNEHRKPVKGSRVIIVGLAYKPDVDDIRETPSFHLMNLLRQQGAIVDYHDALVPVIPLTRENPHWAGQASIPFTAGTFATADAVIIATAHSEVDHRQILAWSPLVIDTRDAIRRQSSEPIPADLARRLVFA